MLNLLGKVVCVLFYIIIERGWKNIVFYGKINFFVKKDYKNIIVWLKFFLFVIGKVVFLLWVMLLR